MKHIWLRPKCTGDVPPHGRHGHTACEYKKQVVIFGGEQRWNPTLGYRECLNDVRYFDPAKAQWKLIKSMGKVIAPRRNHAAAANDKIMIVYGGIGSEGNYLKDVWSFNLSKFFQLFWLILRKLYLD